jgi:hypothetical protein
MSLTYFSRIVSDVAIRHISGCKGVGIHLLRLSVEFQLQAWTEVQERPTVCENIRARILVARPGAAPVALGWAIPESVVSLRPTIYSGRSQLLFDLDLTGAQLHAIEELRSGGDLQFDVQFTGDAQGPQGNAQVHDRISYRVNISEWSHVLRDLGYSDILVVGAELPLVDAGSPLLGVSQCIRRAYDYLHKGLYDVAVGQCRQAFEALYSIEGAQKLANESVERFKSKKASMSKTERERFMAEAVRHYTHLAHHPDDGVMVEFSRADATTVLALTIAALSSAVRREKMKSLAQQDDDATELPLAASGEHAAVVAQAAP